MSALNLVNKTINRRTFLKQAGGGITILFTIRLPQLQAQRGRGYPEDFNAYLRIHENGRISCFTGKIEMGQGIFTSLAQMLADELDVRLDSVDMVMGDTLLCPYDSGTFGSRSTKYFGPPLRQAAATAKQILLELASEELKTPIVQLTAGEGVIFIKGSPDKKVTYAQLAKGKRIERSLGAETSPKHYSKHNISGQSTLRTDSMAKVTGEAQFTGDIRLPGMLYAKVLRPPAHGAQLVDVDVSPARSIPGIQIVREEDFIAVLHEQPDMAEKAMAKIKAEFTNSGNTPDNDSIFQHLLNSATSERVVTENGDIATGKSASTKPIESTFYNHYVAHSPLETHTVLVDVKADKTDVWSATQMPFRVQSMIADILEIATDKVHVRTPFVGGGFGGKKTGSLINEATILSKKTGKPVHIAWSRKEEFFYDTFRPAAIIQATSGVDKNGRITYWDFHHLFSGTRSSEPIYDIPHYRVLSKGSERGGDSAHPFGTGAWRGPGSNTNVFAMESQTDIMAQAANMDPLEFRLKNLSDKRMVRVLEAAAKRFGHSFSKKSSGKGYGIACTNYLNSYVTTMAEVQVNRETGGVQVKRIVCAQDMGEIINPQGATIQIEGGLTMGLGYCLTEEVKFSGKKILTENFDTYDMARFSWLPDIEVELVHNPDLAPQGCGEPAITTMGAVIANAVHDAIGVRLYTLPMTPERILSAIETGKG